MKKKKNKKKMKGRTRAVGGATELQRQPTVRDVEEVPPQGDMHTRESDRENQNKRGTGRRELIT